MFTKNHHIMSVAAVAAIPGGVRRPDRCFMLTRPIAAVAAIPGGVRRRTRQDIGAQGHGRSRRDSGGGEAEAAK